MYATRPSAPFLQQSLRKPVFPDLAQISEATLARVWCKYDGAEDLFQRFERQAADDDLLVIPPFKAWHDSAIIKVLGTTFRKRESLIDGITLNRRGLQGCILQAVARQDFDPQALAAWIAFSLRKLDCEPDRLQSWHRNCLASVDNSFGIS
jgi:hypothetical protein